jgi:plastocyanin
MKRTLVALVASVGIAFIIGSLYFVGHTQALPAPTIDRVGFPTGYKDTFKVFYTFDNYQNRQIRKVWGNSIAASVSPGQTFNFPYGSVILFESYTVKEDSAGEPVLDENGRFIPVNLTTLFVMRKEKGFGEDYKQIRNGEWEYVAYRPDGSYSNPPSATGACALCHLTGGSLDLTAASKPAGANWDFVFRPDLYISGGSGAIPKGMLQHYVFVPSTIHAQPGEVVTVYNYDQLLHRIVADDGSFDTGVMNPGSSFTVKAGAAGSVISYHCVLHSRMKGKIVVDPPAAPAAYCFNHGGNAAHRSHRRFVRGDIFGLESDGSNVFRYPLPCTRATNDETVLNWQKGASGSHTIPAGTSMGVWTFTGVRPHEAETDHSGTFTPVSVGLTVPFF